MKIKTSEVVFRDDLYPRFQPNQAIIEKYSDSIEFLPPIKLDQHKILIDGFHRWKAFQLAGVLEIPFEEINVASEKELKKLAYQLNSNHGLQLSSDEKKRYAQEMFGDLTIKEMASLLGVSEQSIQRWTKTQAEALKAERDRKIIELYLKAWNTQESVAEVIGVGVSTINDIINKFKKRHLLESENIFKPFIYNIWNTSKQDNERKHFGAFPEVFMENLLYYHTNPLDIVFDPFGGGGTSVDVCRKMFRRYYVSDRKVIPGRENDIREWDILNGVPTDLQKPELVFLDPPYWKQAEGKYSNDSEDLGNMELDNFNESMRKLLKELSAWKVNQIAVVIQPTQYKNNWNWTDHIFHFDRMINDKYEILMRYILPYSTEQYLPQMVIKSKEEKKCLGSHRDLVIWKIR